MATTQKSYEWGTLAVTASASTSGKFYTQRGTRIINESGGAVTFSVFEENPVTGVMVDCEDIADIVVADDSSKVIDTAIFASRQICLVLSSGTATLYYVTAE